MMFFVCWLLFSPGNQIPQSECITNQFFCLENWYFFFKSSFSFWQMISGFFLRTVSPSIHSIRSEQFDPRRWIFTFYSLDLFAKHPRYIDFILNLLEWEYSMYIKAFQLLMWIPNYIAGTCTWTNSLCFHILLSHFSHSSFNSCSSWSKMEKSSFNVFFQWKCNSIEKWMIAFSSIFWKLFANLESWLRWKLYCIFAWRSKFFQ